MYLLPFRFAMTNDLTVSCERKRYIISLTENIMDFFKEQEAEATKEVIESLQKQIQIEGQLVVLYDQYERSTENKALKRLMQMFRLDSQRHINILQTVAEVVQGEEIFMEDKEELTESLKKHLELEAEAIKMANNLLGKSIIAENQGLNLLLEGWRYDERRHHKTLQNLTNKLYFRIGSTDFVSMFRDEDFIEERYRRHKEWEEKAEKAKKEE